MITTIGYRKLANPSKQKGRRFPPGPSWQSPLEMQLLFVVPRRRPGPRPVIDKAAKPQRLSPSGPRPSPGNDLILQRRVLRSLRNCLANSRARLSSGQICHVVLLLVGEGLDLCAQLVGMDVSANNIVVPETSQILTTTKLLSLDKQWRFVFPIRIEILRS